MVFEQGSLRFLATGIGSVPFLDIEETCKEIILHFPHAPYWPQFVRRSYLEDMTIQFTESLPLLKVDSQSKGVVLSSELDREVELVKFYDHFLEEDIDYFAVSETYAPGLYTLVRLLGKYDDKRAHNFIKGQIVGPITFAASVKGSDGKALLYDTELMEAMTNGISIKALWQLKSLASTGRRPILFFDEPYLSGFGSAFSPISRERVIEVLSACVRFLKDRADALIGIHCCGNTDWGMLLEAGPDIISFDAYGYMDYFVLYATDIGEFLEKGGHIAWGIVPTSEFTGTETVEDLESRLHQGAARLVSSGVDRDLLWERSILTPSCGMGTMPPQDATLASDILSELAMRLRKEGIQPAR